MTQIDRLRQLLSFEETEQRIFLANLSSGERDELRFHWKLWARPEQLPPPGDWQVWLICAGRGFGKTRAGAEWVRHIAKRNKDARIALVGASIAEVRAIMVEGESGILATSPPKRMPNFEPSLKRLTWPNGAQAMLYSAGEPDSLRGPQHSHAYGTGAEGIFRKRGPCARRHPDASHDRNRIGCTSNQSGGGTMLAGRKQPDGRMGQPIGQFGGMDFWDMAICRSTRGHAHVR